MHMNIYLCEDTPHLFKCIFFPPRRMYLVQHMLYFPWYMVSQHNGGSQSMTKNMLQIATKIPRLINNFFKKISKIKIKLKVWLPGLPVLVKIE